MTDTAARILSAMIRAARTTRSENEMRAIAARMALDTHPDFIA
jgi:hypothetical protein